MKRAEKIIEIESLLENLLKRNREGSLLRMKILFFSSLYENLSIGMIIEKLGIKKTNFALMTAELEKEGCILLKKSSLDKRCRMIELTNKGRAELDAFLKDIEKSLGASSPEIDYTLEKLNNFLNKII
ncbi:MAG: winged helix-turn-helix transcriptional regulator [Clostridia bacterium]|jgi:DNA-binding MarR family transcriptional regulator|nr:winged helix-turn-helix transcriptional regulator [Clostridia bacterium]